jgi:hypothetical protein
MFHIGFMTQQQLYTSKDGTVEQSRIETQNNEHIPKQNSEGCWDNPGPSFQIAEQNQSLLTGPE